jgi:hypothetical protein
MSKLSYRNQEDGKLYKTECGEYFLRCCPKCGKNLHVNSYKSLEVIDNETNQDYMSISLKLQYCKKCDELYILST